MKRGSFGALTELVDWLGGRPLDRVTCVVFAADHGVSEASARADAVALLSGDGPHAVLADEAQVRLRVVDVGLAGEPLPDSSPDRVRDGSASFAAGPSLTNEDVDAAIEVGRRCADAEVDAGVEILLPGALGPGAFLSAACLTAALTRTEPVRALGFDLAVPDAEWAAWCAVVRDGLRTLGHEPLEPVRLLRHVGGLDLAAIVGFLLQAATRTTPVLLDGPSGVVAALLARDIEPDAAEWWRAPHASGVATETLALDQLGLVPPVALGLRLGDGCGALATLGLVRALAAMP